MSLHRALLLILLAAATGCYQRRNAATCDESNPCISSSLPYCNLATHKCESTPPDMTMCADSSCHADGGMDMETCIGSSCIDGGVDANVDMEKPDLGPSCAVATVQLNCLDSANPVCVGGSCAACRDSGDNSQCAAHANGKNFCKTGGGVCVQCNGNSDCGGAMPICDSNVCRSCKAHSECPNLGNWTDATSTGGICQLDGSLPSPSPGACVTSADVSFVDNGNSATCSNAVGTHNGNSPTTAFCDIQSGVNSGKQFVLVEGHCSNGCTPTPGTPYAKFSVTTAKSVVVVGPGPGVTAPATVYDVTADEASLVLGSGNSGGLTIDGLVVGDPSNTTSHNALVCSVTGGGTGKVVVRNSQFQNSANGVNASGCDLTMDEAIVGPTNSKGGISLSNTDFTVQNTIAYLNGNGTSTFGGIQASGAGALGRYQIINSTIADNQAKTTTSVFYTGLDSTVSPTMILNTVIVGNSTTGMAQEIRTGSNLTFDHSAYVGAGATVDVTNCDSAHLFTDPGTGNYTPFATAQSPCTKVLVNAGNPVGAPNHDLHASPRPQPTGSDPDIGAIEVP